MVETQTERTVEHDMATRSLDRIFEVLEAADSLVDNDDLSGKEATLIRRVVEDLTSVIHDLVMDHSAAVILRDVEPHELCCKTCGSTWPCQVYRRIHRSIHDKSRCFETVRVKIFEQRLA